MSVAQGGNQQTLTYTTTTPDLSPSPTVRNPNTGHKYLGGIFQSGVVLLEWVEPMQKFMLVKVRKQNGSDAVFTSEMGCWSSAAQRRTAVEDQDPPHTTEYSKTSLESSSGLPDPNQEKHQNRCITLYMCPHQNVDFQPPCPLEVLELLVVPEQPYPLICVGLNKGTELNQPVSFQTLDPNSSCPTPPDTGTTPPDSCTQVQPLLTHVRRYNPSWLMYTGTTPPDSCTQVQPLLTQVHRYSS